MFSDRMNKKILANSLEGPFITAILGSRRVGKSTFVEHYAQSHPDRLWVFFNMDVMKQRLRVKSEELVQMIVEEGKQRVGGGRKFWVVIDEAQKCPELFEQIKLPKTTRQKAQTFMSVMNGAPYGIS